MTSLTIQLDSELNTVAEEFEFEVDGGSLWYADSDGDGFGNSESPMNACLMPMGYVQNAEDCNDASSVVFPGAPGTGQGLDNDCNGVIEGSEEMGCPGDFNLDGTISVADLLVFLGEFGCEVNCAADFDGDGVVVIGDLLGFLSVFGEGCPN